MDAGKLSAVAVGIFMALSIIFSWMIANPAVETARTQGHEEAKMLAEHEMIWKVRYVGPQNPVRTEDDLRELRIELCLADVPQPTLMCETFWVLPEHNQYEVWEALTVGDLLRLRVAAHNLHAGDKRANKHEQKVNFLKPRLVGK